MTGEVPISVDKHFVRIGSKSYAIQQINTVDVRAQYVHSGKAIFWWGLAAVFSLMIFVGGKETSGAGGALFVIFSILAILAWRKRNLRDYVLLFNTSSGSAQAVKSRDEQYIQGIRDQVERAIAGAL